MPENGPPNYWDYLKLADLLQLQGGLTGDEASVSSDELCFIVVHQTYELWFKLVLRELRGARDLLAADPVPEEDVPRTVHGLERVTQIVRLAVSQFDVMETLPPQDFLAFRDKLVPASGFQSFQVRELEILLGMAEEDRIKLGDTDPLDHIEKAGAGSPGGEIGRERIAAARRETSFLSALRRWLHRTPVRGSTPDRPDDDASIQGFLADYLAAMVRHQERLAARMAETHGEDPEEMRARFEETTAAARSFLTAEDSPEAERAVTRRVRAGILFVESYRELPLLVWPRTLLDRVVELEQGLVMWRARHARMVERVIGRRTGTGGSSGVDYLDRTTEYRVFKELWAVRTLLLPPEALPPLDGAGAYGFAR